MARRKGVIDKAGTSVGVPETMTDAERDGIRSHAQLDANIIIRNAPDPVFSTPVAPLSNWSSAMMKLMSGTSTRRVTDWISTTSPPHIQRTVSMA